MILCLTVEPLFNCSTFAKQEEIKALISSNDIVVFSTKTCPYCHRAKEALTAAGKAYVEHVIASSEQFDALERLSSQSSVPNIWVKGKFVGGCNDGPER